MITRNCCGMKRINLTNILMRKPNAIARIKGSDKYPEIMGKTDFYQTDEGILVVTEVWGLPKSGDKCRNPVFGYHIHSGNKCMENKEDAFADSKAHYNPGDCQHPYHAGDMPPIFGNNGYAFSAFLTNRFCICEIIGKTVIIHLNPDDFHTQPAGASGIKIACGVIEHVDA